MTDTTDPQTGRVTAIYDAIDAFQRTHRLPGLQHAQIRGLLAEHLERALPVAAPPAPADRSGLRERITEAIDRVTGGTCPGDIIDAVLSVLPPDGRAAVLLWAADQLDADMERFFSEWPDEPRNSPYALGRKDAATELRRMAAEERDERQAQANLDQLADGLAAAIASCPGRELDPSPCRCPCYGCKHHCGAHNPGHVGGEERDEQQAQQDGAETCDGCGADLIEDYLRFLRGQGPEPHLTQLPPADREVIAGRFEIVRALADRGPELPPLDLDPVARRLGLHQPAAAPVAGQPPADRLHCPRCQEDITDYAEDDHVFRTGDERPYCSGECVVAAHRAGLPAGQQPDDYEATTGHAITCLAVAGGASDPDCPACHPKFDGPPTTPPAVVAEPGKENSRG